MSRISVRHVCLGSLLLLSFVTLSLISPTHGSALTLGTPTKTSTIQPPTNTPKATATKTPTATPLSTTTYTCLQIPQQSISIPNDPSAWYVMPGTSLGFTTTRTAVVLLTFTGSAWMSINAPNSTVDFVISVQVDGQNRTDLVQEDYEASWGTAGLPNPAIVPVSITVPITLVGGNHVIQILIQVQAVYNFNPPFSVGLSYNHRVANFCAVILP